MDRIEKIIRNLPTSPGVYQFLNEVGRIIYIGKAKNLKSRVGSYFNKKRYESYKTKTLSSKVFDIKHIVVESESDALLLENNLIKKIQPRYNVLLKDDKTFPWICIKNENFPRVFSTRKLVKDGSEYFGPYTSALMVKTLLNLIRNLYQLRTCNFNLSSENIEKGKFKKCLEFHIGNCKAPCEKLQLHDDYQNSIIQIRNILKGNILEVINYLKTMMHEFAIQYKYEEAGSIKQKIALLERYKSKSTIVNPKLNNINIFSVFEQGSYAWVNFLKVISGAIVQSHTVEIQKKLEESSEEVLLFAIIDIRERISSTAHEIIVPFRPIEVIKGVKFVIPKTGDKKRLLELSERNAKQMYLLKQKNSESNSFTKLTQSVLERVKSDLRLNVLPVQIECFDNSNIQGSNPVAACVVFRNGKPSKSDYRHYNIKSVSGINDFASIEEIVYRRYRRLVDEKLDLPQLIIIDGGKGQLCAAVKSLRKLEIYSKVPVIGIAKRLEEIYFPNDKVPIYLDKTSPTLKLIQQIRNEAHRFGISFHRNKRSSEMLTNELEHIKGVGRISTDKLLKEFGSVEQIKKRNFDEISAIVGRKIAAIIIRELNTTN